MLSLAARVSKQMDRLIGSIPRLDVKQPLVDNGHPGSDRNHFCKILYGLKMRSQPGMVCGDGNGQATWQPVEQFGKVSECLNG
jgi:hypothetical protein